MSNLQRRKALQMLAASFLEFKRNKETSSLDFVQVASFCREKSNGPQGNKKASKHACYDLFSSPLDCPVPHTILKQLRTWDFPVRTWLARGHCYVVLHPRGFYSHRHIFFSNWCFSKWHLETRFRLSITSQIKTYAYNDENTSSMFASKFYDANERLVS